MTLGWIAVVACVAAALILLIQYRRQQQPTDQELARLEAEVEQEQQRADQALKGYVPRIPGNITDLQAPAPGGGRAAAGRG